MKSLIVDIYRVAFRITGSKLFAMVFGLLYMATLNFIMIYGLGILMEGWLPMMSIVHKLYAFPFYIVTAIAIIGVTFWAMPPLSTISKESKKQSSPLGIIVYTIFGIVVGLYIMVGDKIF